MENNNLKKRSYEGQYMLILTDCPTVESFRKLEDNLTIVMEFQRSYRRGCRKL